MFGRVCSFAEWYIFVLFSNNNVHIYDAGVVLYVCQLYVRDSVYLLPNSYILYHCVQELLCRYVSMLVILTAK